VSLIYIKQTSQIIGGKHPVHVEITALQKAPHDPVY
jgi:hypothetical protein